MASTARSLGGCTDNDSCDPLSSDSAYVARASRDTRDALLALGEALAPITGSPARWCGRVRAFEGSGDPEGRPNRRAGVDVMLHPGPDGLKARFRGVMKCGSPFCCPTCSDELRARWSADLDAAAALWRANGNRVDMLTLTVRMVRGADLAATHEGLRQTWRDLMEGSPAGRLRCALGIEHWARVVDHTHTSRGWNTHFHVLLFRTGGEPASRSAIRRLQRRWAECVNERMGSEFAPSLGRGARVTPLQASVVYPLKCGAPEAAASRFASGANTTPVFSATVPALIAGRQAGRHPWDVARGAAMGVRRDITAWRGFVRGVHGMQAVTASKGLRRLIAAATGRITSGTGADRSTPRIAILPTQEHVATIPAAIWDQVARRRGARIAILRAAETRGLEGVAHVVALVLRSLYAPAETGDLPRADLESFLVWLRPAPS